MNEKEKRKVEEIVETGLMVRRKDLEGGFTHGTLDTC